MATKIQYTCDRCKTTALESSLAYSPASWARITIDWQRPATPEEIAEAVSGSRLLPGADVPTVIEQLHGHLCDRCAKPVIDFAEGK